MSKSKVTLLLVGILIIAGFLRFYKITEIPPGLYPDEAMNGTNAQEALQTGHFKVYYPENNGREGLFMNIQAGFLKAVGQNEPWVLRMPSAVFGTLTVLGVYFLAAELFSPYIGLLSAFLLATSFWHIMFSRIGFRAIMAPFFLVWASYFFLAAIRKMRKNNERASWIFAISAGISLGLGFYTYIAFRIMPLLFLLFIPFFRKEKNFWRIIGVFFAVMFIVALPIGMYYFQNPADFLGRTAQVSVFSSGSPLKDLSLNVVKTLGMFNMAGDFNWRHNYSGRPELFWPVGVLFLIGIIAIKNLIQKSKIKNQNDNIKIKNEPPKNDLRKFGIWFLFLWFLLAMLPVVISNEGIPHALRSILLIPPAIILASIGGISAYAFLKRYLSGYWLKAIIAFAIAMLISQAYAAYFLAWAKNPNVLGAFAADYAELGRALNALPSEIPKYVVVKANGVLVHGVPMPSQTVMFITDTYTRQGQETKNIHYVLPDDEKNIPAGALKFYIQ